MLHLCTRREKKGRDRAQLGHSRPQVAQADHEIRRGGIPVKCRGRIQSARARGAVARDRGTKTQSGRPGEETVFLFLRGIILNYRLVGKTYGLCRRWTPRGESRRLRSNAATGRARAPVRPGKTAPHQQGSGRRRAGTANQRGTGYAPGDLYFSGLYQLRRTDRYARVGVRSAVVDTRPSRLAGSRRAAMGKAAGSARSGRFARRILQTGSWQHRPGAEMHAPDLHTRRLGTHRRRPGLI